MRQVDAGFPLAKTMSTEVAEPISDKERQLKEQILDLHLVVKEAMEPWMAKRQTKTLDRLFGATMALLRMVDWLSEPRISQDRRKILVALRVYNVNLGEGKNQFIPSKTESVWEQLQKALPPDKRPQAAQLRVALEEHVKPIAHLLQNLKQ